MSERIVLGIGEWMLRVFVWRKLYGMLFHVIRTTFEKFNTFMFFFYTERIIIIAMGFLQGWRVLRVMEMVHLSFEKLMKKWPKMMKNSKTKIVLKMISIILNFFER